MFELRGHNNSVVRAAFPPKPPPARRPIARTFHLAQRKELWPLLYTISCSISMVKPETFVSSPIKMMHMSDPTCFLFGEVGISYKECLNPITILHFSIYHGVPVYNYKAIPLIDIQVD